MSWEFTWLVFATTCIPVDSIRMILSSLNENLGSLLGPGYLAPSVVTVWGPGLEGATS